MNTIGFYKLNQIFFEINAFESIDDFSLFVKQVLLYVRTILFLSDKCDLNENSK